MPSGIQVPGHAKYPSCTATLHTRRTARMVNLPELIEQNRAGSAIGLPSFCTANEHVLRSILQYAAQHNVPALIEATCNQVNQEGGYTGLSAAGFAGWIHAMAHDYGLPPEQLILGGDHLGPNPWRHLPAEQAMARAEALVRDYALAGFQKIHLDASMACGGESTPDFATVAARAARLCRIAEDHAMHPEKLVYVIGTEVPVPGGETDDMSAVSVTSVVRFQDTIDTHREAFARAGLEYVWPRIISVVTQPGVDFSHTAVHRFDPAAAAELSSAILSTPGLSFEAHSTDYQPTTALAALVKQHFFFLKVGPELTFRMREGAFALAAIARELGLGGVDLIECIDAAMDAAPEDWKHYYKGDTSTVRLLRHFSYSDRIRYYWNTPDVRSALDELIRQVDAVQVPDSLKSQYFPERAFGTLTVPAHQLMCDRVQLCVARYYQACGF